MRVLFARWTAALALTVAAAPLLPASAPPTQDPESPDGATASVRPEFERVDRELGSTRIREVEVLTGQWYREPRFVTNSSGMSSEPPPPYEGRFRNRVEGFSEAAVVLPAATRRDGSSMPPTCVFSLPYDGRGSLWLLTPAGLDRECLTPRSLGLDERTTRFGMAVEPGPDWDGDGIDDLIVTAIPADGALGSVFVVSIAERRALFAKEDLDEWALAACAVPDLDGDGLDDLAVLSGPPAPRVRVLSSKDGSVSRTIELAERLYRRWWRPDHRLRLVPQTDPTAALLLFASLPGTSAQELAILDLASGEVRWSTNCDRQETDDDSHWCGLSSVVATEDLDGDGTAELLAAGVREHSRQCTDWSGYTVFSGAAGEELRVVSRIPYHSGGDGEAFVTDYPDLDGDGFREHIVATTTVFSRDLVLFSGRTGEAIYQIDIGELPYEYSNDIQAHVDWNGDGTNDLVLHDTDVWNEMMEQQLIVLDMADHEILHYLRPQELEHAIAAREGITDESASGGDAQGSDTSLRFRDVTFAPDDATAVRVDEDCAGDDVPRAPQSESGDLGIDCATALDVIPATVREDGTPRPPSLAFGLPEDGRGSVCILSTGDAKPLRINAPQDLDNLRRFGEEVFVCHDLDGDGVRDLIVKARYEYLTNRRLFAFSAASGTMLYEFDDVRSNAKQRNACLVVPDRNADGIDDFAVLAVRSGWRDGREFQDGVVFYCGKTGKWLVDVLGMKQRDCAEFGRSVHLRDAVTTQGQIVFLAGGRIHAFDLATQRPTWSKGTGGGPDALFLDGIPQADLDGDGFEELLIAVSESRDDGGRLELRSGRTGDVLRTSSGTRVRAGDHGRSVAAYVDVDGDGVAESVAANGRGPRSSILVLDGRDGTLARHIASPCELGDARFLDAGTDWDGGGLPDLVIGSHVRTVSEFEVCVVSMEDHCVLARWTEGDLRARLGAR